MCNINILLKTSTKKMPKEDLFAFLTAVTTNSYASNPHGEGVYFSNDLLAKSIKKVDFKQFIPNIAESKFIITHQRYATSGHQETYTQPFEEQEFVLIHNGVMHEYARDGHSDTFIVFQEFIKYFSSAGGEREERIIDAIKQIFSDDRGSWSVAIFDKTTETLYYFKDGSTRMNVYRTEDKKAMFMSTNTSNETFLPILQEDFRTVKIEPYKIYSIKINQKVKLNEVGTIKHKVEKETVVYAPSFNYNHYRETFTAPKKSRFKKTHKFDEIHPSLRDLKKRYVNENADNDYCQFCQQRTKNIFVYSGAVICDDCLEEDPSAFDEEAVYERDFKTRYV